MGGSMGASKSEADSSNQNQFSQDVWGGQSGALQDLYGAAGQLFGQTNAGMQQQIPGAVQGMQDITSQANPYWNQQMQGGAYADMGLQNQLMDSLQQSQNSPTAMQDINNMIMGGEGNNYADAMRDQYTQDATRAQENMLQNLDARAAASGMSGGSRQGVATAMGMEDINKNLQGNMARVGYDTFNQDLDRKLQIAQQADQGTLARQQLMGDMVGDQQQAMAGGLASGQGMQQLNMGQFSPYNSPWQSMGNYSQAIGSPTVLGSGSGSGQSSAKGFGMSGSGGMK